MYGQHWTEKTFHIKGIAVPMQTATSCVMHRWPCISPFMSQPLVKWKSLLNPGWFRVMGTAAGGIV